MDTKTQKLKNLVQAGQMKEALKLAKDFKKYPKAGQRLSVARAWEALVRPESYKQIGKDPDALVDAGIQVIMEVYGKQE